MLVGVQLDLGTLRLDRYLDLAMILWLIVFWNLIVLDY